MPAPSEHTGNCIGFTLEKGSYNPVKGLWKGLQWCKVCCENQVRISPLPTRLPNFLQLHPLFQSICALLPLLLLQPQSNKDKAASKPLWAISLSHKTSQTAFPSVAQTGMAKKGPLENWQLHTSHCTEKGNKPLHRITQMYTKGRWIFQ